MSKLSTIRKQIAALEAQAERISRVEMSAAIAKVKGLMADFGLTIEHLTHAVTGKSTARKTKASSPAKKTKTASVAKYADPKSDKTWSGFGRAPAWIAGAKNREPFLVGAGSASSMPAAAKKKTAPKAAAPASKSAKAKASRVTKAAATKAAIPNAAATKKTAAVKKAATKKVVKPKSTGKKVARKTSAKLAASAPTEAHASAG